MKHRLIAAAMATSLSLLTVPTLSAAPRLFGEHTTVGDKAPKGKSISFRLRNDSKTALTIKAGDRELTVKPGETTALKLATGEQVIAVTGTDNIAAGTVLAMVTSNLDGNTLAVR